MDRKAAFKPNTTFNSPRGGPPTVSRLPMGGEAHPQPSWLLRAVASQTIALHHGQRTARSPKMVSLTSPLVTTIPGLQTQPHGELGGGAVTNVYSDFLT